MKPTKKQLQECVANHPDEGIIGTLIVRKISIQITNILARTSVTPNQITFISFLMGILSAYCISLAEHNFLILGGIIFFISYIIDNVDGEIARLKNLGSKKGAFLDSSLDRIKEGAVFFAISYALFIQTQDYLSLIYGFIAFFSVTTTNTIIQASGKMDSKALRKTHSSLPFIKFLSSLGIKQSFFTLGVDLQAFIISLGLVLNQLFYTLWFFILFQNLYWILILLFVYGKKE